MELHMEGSNRHAASTSHITLTSIDEVSTIRSTKLLAWNPTLFTTRSPSSVGNFDQNLQRDLSESHVYARNRYRFSLNTRSSSTGQSLGCSLFSKYSLAAVSNISVIRLPIYSRDLWNPQYYHFPDSAEADDMKDPPSADTASTVTAMSGMDSLIDQLLVRDAPDYKIALLGQWRHWASIGPCPSSPEPLNTWYCELTCYMV